MICICPKCGTQLVILIGFTYSIKYCPKCEYSLKEKIKGD